jgi:tRNA dimethylallyltransferase
LPVAQAHAELAQADPEAAARLRPSDSTRVARALEVVRATGRPLSLWQQALSGGIAERVALRPLLLLPPRDWLYARCDARFSAMLSDDGIAEVRALLARRLSPSLPVMRAIGVREISAFAQGRLTRAEALAAGQQATRNYAKRQYTWFRHQPPPEWTRWERPVEDPEPLLHLLRPA